MSSTISVSKQAWHHCGLTYWLNPIDNLFQCCEHCFNRNYEVSWWHSVWSSWAYETDIYLHGMFSSKIKILVICIWLQCYIFTSKWLYIFYKPINRYMITTLYNIIIIILILTYIILTPNVRVWKDSCLGMYFVKTSSSSRSKYKDRTPLFLDTYL